MSAHNHAACFTVSLVLHVRGILVTPHTLNRRRTAFPYRTSHFSLDSCPQKSSFYGRPRIFYFRGDDDEPDCTERFSEDDVTAAGLAIDPFTIPEGLTTTASFRLRIWQAIHVRLLVLYELPCAFSEMSVSFPSQFFAGYESGLGSVNVNFCSARL